MVDDTKVLSACMQHPLGSIWFKSLVTCDNNDLFLSFFEKDLLGATDAGLPPPNVEVFCIHGSQVLALFVMLLMMTLVLWWWWHEPNSDYDENDGVAVARWRPPSAWSIRPARSLPPWPPSSPALRTRARRTSPLERWFLVVSYMSYVPISPFHQSWWPFPKGPSLVKGDGDGTVNIRSLEVLIMFLQFQTLPYMLWKPEYKYQSKGLLEVEGLPEAGRPPQGVQGDQPRGHAQKRYVVIIEILIILVRWGCNNSGWFAIERVVMI